MTAGTRSRSTRSLDSGGRRDARVPRGARANRLLVPSTTPGGGSPSSSAPLMTARACPRHRGRRSGRARARCGLRRRRARSRSTTPRSTSPIAPPCSSRVTAAQPDVVIHAAAWTAVDACEADPDRAFAVNGLGTRHVAEASRRVGAHLVALSTDYVFDGEKPTPYHEWDTPNPRSVYGASKLAGETELAEAPDTTIVRISWVCGAHGSNMVKTILKLASEHDSLSFVDDQRGQPDLRGRRGGGGAPARRRPPPGHLPRDEPGRGDLVRVRTRGARVVGAGSRLACTPSRPPSSTRRAPRPGRRTRCSTTPRSAFRVSPCCRSTASRSTASSHSSPRDESHGRRRRGEPRRWSADARLPPETARDGVARGPSSASCWWTTRRPTARSHSSVTRTPRSRSSRAP